MQNCSSIAEEWKTLSTASYVKITRLGMTSLKLISTRACSSSYSKGERVTEVGMTMLGLTLYWRLMRDFQTKGRGEKGELAAAVKLHGLIPHTRLATRILLMRDRLGIDLSSSFSAGQS